MITVDYSQEVQNAMWSARTLSPGDIGTHDDGWTIEGVVCEDYYEWVNDFTATHPVYGKIEGNFEHEVTAESQLALDHFLKYHMYVEWDYADI